jgi:peroxiredoxin
MTDDRRPLRAGDRAPDFTLPGINRDGAVRLDEFRGRSAVLIGLFRGLHCPFCRRQIVQLGSAQPRLRSAGVETVAVVNTPVERGRLYFRYRPTPVVLASDPDVLTHRAFGLPKIELVPEGVETRWPHRATHAQLLAVPVNPTGELPQAVNVFEAMSTINAKEGFQATAADEQIVAAHGTQLAGQFLVDRDGVVRWAWLEAPERIADLARFPTDEDVWTAVRALAN